jgi:hypothetical protein
VNGSWTPRSNSHDDYGMIELVASGVTTRTSTVPLPGVGGAAEMMVSPWTVKLGDGVAPKSTAVAPVSRSR